MSNTVEKYDLDAEWFYEQMEKAGKKPTEAQEQAFCERVAILWADGHLTERDARAMALKMVLGG